MTRASNIYSTKCQEISKQKKLCKYICGAYQRYQSFCPIIVLLKYAIAFTLLLFIRIFHQIGQSQFIYINSAPFNITRKATTTMGRRRFKANHEHNHRWHRYDHRWPQMKSQHGHELIESNLQNLTSLCVKRK